MPARIAWKIYTGKDPNNLLVCHHCDNIFCVNPEHLFLGTSSDNIKDMLSKGWGNKAEGKEHCRSAAKLTEKDVKKIKKLLISGQYKQHEIAQQFDVGQTCISRIKTGIRWSYL